MRRIARRVVVVVLVAGLAACGSGSEGGGDGDGGGAETSSESNDTTLDTTLDTASADSPTPIAVGEATVALHGPAGGVAATLYALDAGFSVAQLSVAALDGALAADGSIPGVEPVAAEQGVIAAPVEGFRYTTGTPERTPDEVQGEIDRKLATLETINLLGAPLGVFGDIGYQEVFPPEPAATGPEVEPADEKAAAAEIGVIVALVDMGYSFDQVVNGFIFGEVTLAMGVDRSGDENPLDWHAAGGPAAPCFVLRDSTGEAIVPSAMGARVLLGSTTCARAVRAGTISFDGVDGLRRGSDSSTPAEGTSPDEPAEFPRTYRTDTGSHYLTDFAYDVAFDCTTPGPMELVLAADGTATFTYFNGVGVVATLDADGAPQISCEQRSGNSWTGTYDPELLTVEILPPTPDGFAHWDFGGTFDPDEAYLYGTYSLPANPAGQQLVVEIEATMPSA